LCRKDDCSNKNPGKGAVLKKGLIVSAAFTGGFMCTFGPVLAQDEESGLRQRLRVEQTFGVGDNLGLQVPSEGSTSLSTTRLSYGLESITRNQSLTFGIGGALRFGSIASGNSISTGLTDPVAGLRYTRDTGGALLSFDGDYRVTDISLTGPLWTFLDQDGFVQPPRDFSDLTGSGKREAYRLNARLETGREDPIGFVFTGAADGVRYTDQTDADLSDYDNTSLGVSTLFRFNPVTTGFVDLRYSDYQSVDFATADRKTKTAEVGFDRDVSARARLLFRVGYTDIESLESGVTTTTSGPSGRVGYTVDLPNGNFDANFDVRQTQDGRRNTLRFGRALDLPLGSLSANIGLTNVDSGDPEVIGGLNWQRRMADSTFGLRLNRDVVLDAEDDERVTTTFITTYTYEINTISRISADLALSDAMGNAFSNRVRRGDLVLSYERELTNDWSMNAGIDLRRRDEDTVGRADASAVFFGIGRNFDLSN
jgi:hypothetical protein